MPRRGFESSVAEVGSGTRRYATQTVDIELDVEVDVDVDVDFDGEGADPPGRARGYCNREHHRTREDRPHARGSTSRQEHSRRRRRDTDDREVERERASKSRRDHSRHGDRDHAYDDAHGQRVARRRRDPSRSRSRSPPPHRRRRRDRSRSPPTSPQRDTHADTRRGHSQNRTAAPHARSDSRRRRRRDESVGGRGDRRVREPEHDRAERPRDTDSSSYHPVDARDRERRDRHDPSMHRVQSPSTGSIDRPAGPAGALAAALRAPPSDASSRANAEAAAAELDGVAYTVLDQWELTTMTLALVSDRVWDADYRASSARVKARVQHALTKDLCSGVNALLEDGLSWEGRRVGFDDLRVGSIAAAPDTTTFYITIAVQSNMLYHHVAVGALLGTEYFTLSRVDKVFRAAFDVDAGGSDADATDVSGASDSLADDAGHPHANPLELSRLSRSGVDRGSSLGGSRAATHPILLPLHDQCELNLAPSAKGEPVPDIRPPPAPDSTSSPTSRSRRSRTAKEKANAKEKEALVAGRGRVGAAPRHTTRNDGRGGTRAHPRDSKSADDGGSSGGTMAQDGHEDHLQGTPVNPDLASPTSMLSVAESNATMQPRGGAMPAASRGTNHAVRDRGQSPRRLPHCGRGEASPRAHDYHHLSHAPEAYSSYSTVGTARPGSVPRARLGHRDRGYSPTRQGGRAQPQQQQQQQPQPQPHPDTWGLGIADFNARPHRTTTVGRGGVKPRTRAHEPRNAPPPHGRNGDSEEDDAMYDATAAPLPTASPVSGPVVGGATLTQTPHKRRAGGVVPDPSQRSSGVDRALEMVHATLGGGVPQASTARDRGRPPSQRIGSPRVGGGITPVADVGGRGNLSEGLEVHGTTPACAGSPSQRWKSTAYGAHGVGRAGYGGSTVVRGGGRAAGGLIPHDLATASPRQYPHPYPQHPATPTSPVVRTQPVGARAQLLRQQQGPPIPDSPFDAVHSALQAMHVTMTTLSAGGSDAATVAALGSGSDMYDATVPAGGVRWNGMSSTDDDRPLPLLADQAPTPHVIIGPHGALLRAGVALDSAKIGTLPNGTVVDVVETMDRRARVVTPTAGWLSITDAKGGALLEPLAAPAGGGHAAGEVGATLAEMLDGTPAAPRQPQFKWYASRDNGHRG